MLKIIAKHLFVFPGQFLWTAKEKKPNTSMKFMMRSHVLIRSVALSGSQVLFELILEKLTLWFHLVDDEPALSLSLFLCLLHVLYIRIKELFLVYLIVLGSEYVPSVMLKCELCFTNKTNWTSLFFSSFSSILVVFLYNSRIDQQHFS